MAQIVQGEHEIEAGEQGELVSVRDVGESEDIARDLGMTRRPTCSGSTVHAASTLVPPSKWLQRDAVRECPEICDSYTERCCASAQKIADQNMNARSA